MRVLRAIRVLRNNLEITFPQQKVQSIEVGASTTTNRDILCPNGSQHEDTRPKAHHHRTRASIRKRVPGERRNRAQVHQVAKAISRALDNSNPMNRKTKQKHVRVTPKVHNHRTRVPIPKIVSGARRDRAQVHQVAKAIARAVDDSNSMNRKTKQKQVRVIMRRRVIKMSTKRTIGGVEEVGEEAEEGGEAEGWPHMTPLGNQWILILAESPMTDLKNVCGLEILFCSEEMMTMMTFHACAAFQHWAPFTFGFDDYSVAG
jgi:hypothetical protein